MKSCINTIFYDKITDIFWNKYNCLNEISEDRLKNLSSILFKPM